MQSDKIIVINTNRAETRIALLEAGQLTELFIERSREQSRVGNIYKGTVTRVLPGMQAAFINIGFERTAFLYGGDAVDFSRPPQAEDSDEGRFVNKMPIESLLTEGQDIVVQVAKEALGTKGARVTMFLSLPGRFVVLLPNLNHVGISKRIEAAEDRARLTDLVQQHRPQNCGAIVRTAALNASPDLIQREIAYLYSKWEKISARAISESTPAQLHSDIGLIEKTVRDLLSDDVGKIIVDDEATANQLNAFLQATIPGSTRPIEVYNSPKPIFDEFGVEIDISRALSARIDLPSGGHIIVDQTEALTSFDVNTGKYVGSSNARDTILKTNLEAVSKVVEQLRIRNIGGLIVIDLIDMESVEDKDLVYGKLQDELKRDKARTNVLRISDLGLVQMTRKRTSESLERQLTDICPHCEGRGRIRSTATEAYDLLREIARWAIQTGKKKITVRVREDIRDFLLSEESELFEGYLSKLKLKVHFEISALKLTHLGEAAFEVVG